MEPIEPFYKTKPPIFNLFVHGPTDGLNISFDRYVSLASSGADTPDTQSSGSANARALRTIASIPITDTAVTENNATPSNTETKPLPTIIPVSKLLHAESDPALNVNATLLAAAAHQTTVKPPRKRVPTTSPIVGDDHDVATDTTKPDMTAIIEKNQTYFADKSTQRNTIDPHLKQFSKSDTTILESDSEIDTYTTYATDILTFHESLLSIIGTPDNMKVTDSSGLPKGYTTWWNTEGKHVSVELLSMLYTKLNTANQTLTTIDEYQSPQQLFTALQAYKTAILSSDTSENTSSPIAPSPESTPTVSDSKQRIEITPLNRNDRPFSYPISVEASLQMQGPYKTQLTDLDTRRAQLTHLVESMMGRSLRSPATPTPKLTRIDDHTVELQIAASASWTEHNPADPQTAPITKSGPLTMQFKSEAAAHDYFNKILDDLHLINRTLAPHTATLSTFKLDQSLLVNTTNNQLIQIRPFTASDFEGKAFGNILADLGKKVRHKVATTVLTNNISNIMTNHSHKSEKEKYTTEKNEHEEKEYARIRSEKKQDKEKEAKRKRNEKQRAELHRKEERLKQKKKAAAKAKSKKKT